MLGVRQAAGARSKPSAAEETTILNRPNLTPGRSDSHPPSLLRHRDAVLQSLGIDPMPRRREPAKPKPPKQRKRPRLAWDVSYIEPRRWRVTHPRYGEIWCGEPLTRRELADVAEVARAQAQAIYAANPEVTYGDMLNAIYRATNTRRGRPKYPQEFIAAMQVATYEFTRS